MTHLIHFRNAQGESRWGIQSGEQIKDITAHIGSLTAWLQSSVNRVDDAIGDLLTFAESASTIDPQNVTLLPPIESAQDVWAAGVTYERSRSARQEEATDGGDVYARVYSAERPELFFKARGSRVVGHLAQVGIREDSAWNVPEPEFTLVINPALEVVGVTIGNDMSSRDIEGANPLYLPQAKVYTASCALGPAIALGKRQNWQGERIEIQIERAGETAFSGDITTDSIHRQMLELVNYLGRSNPQPDGVFLMTGTGIVPPNDFTLLAGDTIHITIAGIGTLTNTVKVV